MFFLVLIGRLGMFFPVSFHLFFSIEEITMNFFRVGLLIFEDLQPGFNLNPVVVLTDFRKALGSSSTSLLNHASEKERAQSIPAETESNKNSARSFKVKSGRTISVNKSPVKAPTLALSKPEQIKSISWDPSVEYEIEKIVGYHRDKRKKMWYLVKWKHWSSEHNTFETIENLTGCNYKLMKHFEERLPTSREMHKKDMEIKRDLKKREIYKRLRNKKWKVEDNVEFSHECPQATRLFEMKLTKLLEFYKMIRKEYMYIIRCLIAMLSHEDPGLVLRAQKYKLLLTLIQMRQKQLQKLALVEMTINSVEQAHIVVENAVDLDDFPNINYTDKIIPGKDVEFLKDPLLGCECSSCSPSSRCCGVLKDSVFAYKDSGKLRTSKRIAIYECNERCRCPPSCPNRVVQQGRRVKLSIFKTKSCGWGVRTLENIPKGKFVCEYVGELIPDSEAVVRDVKYFAQKLSGYLFDLDFFTDLQLDMYCLDATKQGNVARFINHSCDPNLVVYPVWIDSIEPNIHRLAFFSRRNILKGEEIHFDYENLEEFSQEEENDMKGHGLRMLSNVKCQCNAPNCREWVFGCK